MGNTTDNSPYPKDVKRRRPCRVAYSLNNEQPVACTIISDEPLFYMDHEEAYYDDDDILMDEELLALDRDIQALKKKVEAYDRLSLEFTQPADARTREFMADTALIGETCVAENRNIEVFLSALRKSRMAQALMASVEEHKVSIAYSDQIKGALYDRAGSQILLNPNMQQADLFLLAARELRRHWQHRQGVLIDPLSFSPDQAVLVNRAQQADLSVAMVRIAWELQLSGTKEAWERVENSPLSDLGRTLAREAYVDFRTLNNGNAASAVFETWFLSDRCRAADKEIIQKMLADYQGLVFDEAGVAKSVTMDLICALGSVPFGKNYLSPYAQMILHDPVFTDVRDRSNANFLWFIKFEKSFRETEQELQIEEANQKPGLRSGNSIINSQDTRNDEEIIVELPIHNKHTARGGSKLENADDTTNVVYVQFCERG